MGSTHPEPQPSIFSMEVTEGQPTWPPPSGLMEAYDSAMKKVRGEPFVKEETKVTELKEKSIGEASQPTATSGTTISAAQATEIRAQVHQAI